MDIQLERAISICHFDGIFSSCELLNRANKVKISAWLGFDSKLRMNLQWIIFSSLAKTINYLFIRFLQAIRQIVSIKAAPLLLVRKARGRELHGTACAVYTGRC